MSLYRIDFEILDRIKPAFYCVKNDKVWLWRDVEWYKLDWDPRTDGGEWTNRQPASQLEFLLLTGKVFREPSEDL